jgi:copper(I)-binding protein
MKNLISGAALALSLIAPVVASAGSAFDTVSISDARARAVPKVAPASGAFLTLKNKDSIDHVIVAAESPVAKAVELHTHTNDNGVMRMRKIDSIKVPAGGMTMLKPGGLHIMFIGLNQELKNGDSVPLTLVFADGSRVVLDVPVKDFGKHSGMGGGHMQHMHHQQ